MELAIPVLVLGSLYIISNKNKPKENMILKSSSNFVDKNLQSIKKENYENMGKSPNYLPNNISTVKNFPTTN